MSVTLDVSRLSGWLNADACCRVEKRAYAMQGEVRAGRRAGREGGGGASGMHGEGPTQGWGPQRARAERTSNMPRMFVTLDVSKASGWLNADADCRVVDESKGGHTERDEVRASEGGRGRGAGTAQAACTGRAGNQGDERGVGGDGFASG